MHTDTQSSCRHTAPAYWCTCHCRPLSLPYVGDQMANSWQQAMPMEPYQSWTWKLVMSSLRTRSTMLLSAPCSGQTKQNLRQQQQDHSLPSTPPAQLAGKRSKLQDSSWHLSTACCPTSGSSGCLLHQNLALTHPAAQSRCRTPMSSAWRLQEQQHGLQSVLA